MLRRSVSRSEGVGLFVALGILLGLLYLRSFAQPYRYGAMCISNAKQTALSALIYASDYDDRLPPGDWIGPTKPYARHPDNFRCTVVDEGKGGYAMNGHLKGKLIGKVENPTEVALFFESNDLTPGATGWRLDPLDPTRHENHLNLAYLSGAGKNLRNDALTAVRLIPAAPSKK